VLRPGTTVFLSVELGDGGRLEGQTEVAVEPRGFGKEEKTWVELLFAPGQSAVPFAAARLQHKASASTWEGSRRL
jgi:hypothetical protein